MSHKTRMYCTRKRNLLLTNSHICFRVVRCWLSFFLAIHYRKQKQLLMTRCAGFIDWLLKCLDLFRIINRQIILICGDLDHGVTETHKYCG